MIYSPYIFRSYDIRGLSGSELDDEFYYFVGKAYGTYLIGRNIFKIVCGFDGRIGSDKFQRIFIKGVVSTGVDVVDIGMVMTQMVYFSQYLFSTKGAAMITASHNPASYNGLKLAIDYSETTGPVQLKEIQKLLNDDDYYEAKTPGTVLRVDVREAYINDILKRLRIGKKYRVLVDSRCGTTGLFMPELFRRAGCEVIEMNTKVDGTFPKGTPDPTDEKIMRETAAKVVYYKADVGFVFDGDGDRVGVIDDKGNVIWNDVILAVFAKDLLTRFKGEKIVYNTLCSQVVQETVLQNGGEPIMWRTGHSFLKSKMKMEKAVLGGELSGHFFFADNFYGHDDGAYAAMRLLGMMEKENKSLSEIVASLPYYISSPEIKLGCDDSKKKMLLEKIKTELVRDYPNSRIVDDRIIPGDDGVRADFSDGMIIVRYSQNGPYITVKFEAKTDEVFNKRQQYLKNLLRKFPEIDFRESIAKNTHFLI